VAGTQIAHRPFEERRAAVEHDGCGQKQRDPAQDRVQLGAEVDVEFRPRLPQRHAEMAEFYLARTQPLKAWPFARRAAELDQRSAKYLELSLETAILLGDRTEAHRRYDKFRLLSDDRAKAQSFKEKIDALPS